MSRRETGASGGIRAHDDVLGYLLKHAHLVLEHRTDAALGELGVTARDLGVLRVIAGGVARSQQEIAALLAVDRTSMVSLVDSLERRGLVARRPSERDRRRNVVELTDEGTTLFARAERLAVAAERRFTSSLDDDGAAALRRTLRTVLDARPPDASPPDVAPPDASPSDARPSDACPPGEPGA